MVLRRIETRIPTVDELSLSPVIKTLAMTKRGIVIFVGATGAGKSTSLAAMIGYRNQNSTGHIITIEDPIEFVHKHEGCIITQREVGIDTDSWENALKNTLRQAPDVIMIGEVRTREGMDHAIAFAETGHLVLCTLHANNANQAMDRIINFFPKDRRNQLLMDLSLNLKGVVAQQLIPTPDGRSRRVAMEIMLGTPLVQDYIRDGEIHKLKEIMKESTNLGMRTFDQSLFELYQAGEISYEDALRYADSQNEVRLRIKLSQGAMPRPCRRAWMVWRFPKFDKRVGRHAGARPCKETNSARSRAGLPVPSSGCWLRSGDDAARPPTEARLGCASARCGFRCNRTSR